LACGDENGSAGGSPTVPYDAGTKKDASTGSPVVDSGEEPPDVDAGPDAKAWPTCAAKPPSATAKTIPQIWQADPAKETEVWIADAYVTGISSGQCSANEACQLFVQDGTSYADLASAAKHAIKLFVSANTAQYFTTIAVGDKVDVLGWAWRYDLNGQHELLVQVNYMLPGCAKTKSKANTLTPLAGVELSQLSVDVYENTHGPLFVKLENVSGRPGTAKETFGLWPTPDGGPFDGGFVDAGGANIVSASPFFLAGGSFTDLAAGVPTRFTSITGVFGLFVPMGGPKYLELYPRTPDDIVVAP
jgi:hypothetical protein